MFSHIQLFATPWTVAHQAPLSMEFSRQEYWNGLSFPVPEDLHDPGIKTVSPELAVDSLSTEPSGKSNSYMNINNYLNVKIWTEGRENGKSYNWDTIPILNQIQ